QSMNEVPPCAVLTSRLGWLAPFHQIGNCICPPLSHAWAGYRSGPDQSAGLVRGITHPSARRTRRNYCSSVVPKLPELFAHPNVVPLAVNWLAGGWRGPILSVTPP